MMEDIPEAYYLENVKNSFPESSEAKYEGFKDYDRPENMKKIGMNLGLMGKKKMHKSGNMIFQSIFQ